MGTPTSPDNLYEPSIGEVGWGDEINATLATLQARLADLGANVKSFGAKGDGVTNDTAAFVAAFAAGRGVVFVPPGIYLVDPDQLNITVDGTWLFSFGGATIKARVAGGTLLKITNGKSGQLQGIILDAAGLATDALYLHQCAGMRLIDSSAKNALRCGVFGDEGGTNNHLHFDRFEASDNLSEGIHLQAGSFPQNNHEFHDMVCQRNGRQSTGAMTSGSAVVTLAPAGADASFIASSTGTCSITAAQRTVTLSAGTIDASHVGSGVVITGADAGGTDLYTWVATVTDSTHFTVSTAASTTVSGVSAWWGRDVNRSIAVQGCGDRVVGVSGGSLTLVSVVKFASSTTQATLKDAATHTASGQGVFWGVGLYSSGVENKFYGGWKSSGTGGQVYAIRAGKGSSGWLFDGDLTEACKGGGIDDQFLNNSFVILANDNDQGPDLSAGTTMMLVMKSGNLTGGAGGHLRIVGRGGRGVAISGSGSARAVIQAIGPAGENTDLALHGQGTGVVTTT
jgi:hypothetical protein